MSVIKKGVNEFFIAIDGEIVAKIEFAYGGRDTEEREILIINHTVVADKHRGEGLGRSLVDRVVDYARREHQYIIPLCPFAKLILENGEQYKDILR